MRGRSTARRCASLVLLAALVGCGPERTPRPGACGDGVVDDGYEACDCGDDPATLSPWCTAVNGAVGSECDADCELRCGNGIVEWGEDCDCGLDPRNVPVGCLDINGAPGSGCPLDCWRGPACGDGLPEWPYEECDPPDGITCDTSPQPSAE